jgi:hypothetical protein
MRAADRNKSRFRLARLVSSRRGHARVCPLYLPSVAPNLFRCSFRWLVGATMGEIRDAVLASGRLGQKHRNKFGATDGAAAGWGLETGLGSKPRP